ncbi:MAG: hypothetical protein ACM3L8_07485, partial [Verrucomicrobiota bacterium]
MAGRHTFLRRLAAFSLFAVLFVTGFLLTVAYTLSGETVLSLIRPALRNRNADISAEDARLVFPV